MNTWTNKSHKEYLSVNPGHLCKDICQASKNNESDDYAFNCNYVFDDPVMYEFYLFIEMHEIKLLMIF